MTNPVQSEFLDLTALVFIDIKRLREAAFKKTSWKCTHRQLCHLTWMHPFLKTGTFHRRASLTRAASSRMTRRPLSTAPGFFIATVAQARLHPGHTHLKQEEEEEEDTGRVTVGTG